MEIKYENLEKIDDVINLLNQLLNRDDSMGRWLTTKKAAEYLEYSKDSIDSKIKKSEFILDVHYYQNGSKRLFDRTMLDKWVMGLDKTDVHANNGINNTINTIVKQFTA